MGSDLPLLKLAQRWSREIRPGPVCVFVSFYMNFFLCVTFDTPQNDGVEMMETYVISVRPHYRIWAAVVVDVVLHHRSRDAVPRDEI